MKDFAIRYTEDFTEDIYKALIDWCSKNITPLKWYGIFNDTSFSIFKKKGWFRHSEYCNTVGVDNNSQGSPEITLSELCEMIGYKKAEIISKPEEKVTPKFEVGKWYFWNNDEGFWLRTSKIEKQRVYYDQYIHIKKSNHSYKGSYYGMDHECWGSKLTDLSEIQQYLPDGHVDKLPVKQDEMKELTELPEKWCIEVTNENRKILNDWRKNIPYLEFPNHIVDVGHTIIPKYSLDRTCYFTGEVKSFRKRYSDYTEITFEQFKKWVLKESDVPEYVECIEKSLYYFGEVGKIYKVKDWNRTTDDFELFENLNRGIAKKRFKPSTKEAYDAQFKKNDYQNLLDLEVGDTVRCISNNESKVSYNKRAGAGWEAGLEFVITHISKYSDHNIYFRGNQGVYSDAVRLVKKRSSVEPWSAGTYVVFSKEGSHRQPLGTIDLIRDGDRYGDLELRDYRVCIKDRIQNQEITWFATEAEAEEFAKQFKKVTPVVDTIEPQVAESNLEKATRLFKVGTKGRTVYDTPFTITKSSLPLIDRGYDIIDSNQMWVLYNRHSNKWATIESTPQGNWYDDAILSLQVQCTTQLDGLEYKVAYDPIVKPKDNDLIDINFEIPIVIGA